MRFFFALAVLLFFFSAALVSAHNHFASGHPSAWKQLTRVSDSHVQKISLAIQQKNLDRLSALVDTVSDIESPLYGHYLTYEEVNKLTRNEVAISAVQAFLLANGASSVEVSESGNYVHASISAQQSSELFNAPIFHFAHAEHGSLIERALSYQVPAEIAQFVTFIARLAHFPALRNIRASGFYLPSVGINTKGNTFPSLLNKYYNITSNTVTNKNATQSCFEDGQYISNTDLEKFQSTYGLPKQDLAAIIGDNKPALCIFPNFCAESTLDFEYIMAVAQGSPTSYYGIVTTDQEAFYTYLTDLSNTANPPLVNSISYGEVEQNADPAEVNGFNTEAQKLGLRGVTIVVASGDDGVANFPARNDLSKCGFYPSFPASSPYVVAVGATQGPENSQTEVVESSDAGGLITSGGGFSTLSARPSWQSSAVSNFLSTSTKLPPSGQYNGNGRGYPDVAILGHNYETIIGGNGEVVSGTSASAPVFAGMLTLINSQRLSLGKPAVGFVNPALYTLAAQQPAVFHDITSGKNNCVAGTGTSCCTYGFYAQAGWDPITGLGSVNFGALKDALVNL